ncbi:MAG: ferritin-like domain-containing protein, partial [Halobacteriota archaeon]
LAEDATIDPGRLTEAAAESHEHRDRLAELIDELQADTVAYEEVERLVRERYARTEPEDFDDLLYDQLCNEETAYKFYDDLIAALAASEATFSIERDRLITVLREIREEEAEGVEDVTAVMEEYP